MEGDAFGTFITDWNRNAENFAKWAKTLKSFKEHTRDLYIIFLLKSAQV
jgi:hypothetical protein